MTLLQAFLIGVIGWLVSMYAPTTFIGSNIFGRPLLAGMIIGIILGDVTTGIILGAAIQALYIGIVAPGGTLPADVNYASFISIPLAMVAGVGTEYTLTMAVALSMLGAAATYATVTINLYFVHRQDKLISEGKLAAATKMPVVGQLSNFAFRFIPIFAINYFGADLMTKLLAIIPEQVTAILQIFAGMLPLVGFIMLLKMIVKKNFDLVFFALGFILVVAMRLQMIPIVIIACVMAYVDFKYGKTDEKEEGILT